MVNSPDADGLYARIKALAATFVAAGRTRLELLDNEYQLEKERVVKLLLFSQALLFCLVLGLFLLVALAALLFPDRRLEVFAVAAAFFLGLACFFYLRIRQLFLRAGPVFPASLAELAEDLRQLKAASGHEQTPD